MQACLLEDLKLTPLQLSAKLQNRFPSSQILSITKIENFKHYHLGMTNENLVVTVRNLVNEYSLKEDQNFEKQSILFLDDATGTGTGTHDDPFGILMTSQSLLQNYERIKEKNIPLVLHVDDTYKVTYLSYPVLILGLTDANSQISPFIVFNNFASNGGGIR
ncbi:hypothetical protein ROZALSC1DRAFT_29928 [Rozella allomycis CSF55]|uniref:Uncharacterized protein n=1 Tax=Rozella allomycis (strain CSF55) TaxID=988480 RepID=A0A075AN10_ROZAC|nr:hypothetical protein O9G_006260 [Rozella allomycis CSF55]RKP18377.1 hypothetical protein ROZALSC1DRAFT_29928 [Rozella allomycis CSF55]|eukprot:EPZ31083.1 hypothetical protein O9G_006260 [Rozella allomycis CSF55]